MMKIIALLSMSGEVNALVGQLEILQDSVWLPVGSPCKVEDGMEGWFRTWPAGWPFPKEVWVRGIENDGLNTSVGHICPNTSASLDDCLSFRADAATKAKIDSRPANIWCGSALEEESDTEMGESDMYD